MLLGRTGLLMTGGTEKGTPRGLERRVQAPPLERGRGDDRRLESAGARMIGMELEGGQGAGGKYAQALRWKPYLVSKLQAVAATL